LWESATKAKMAAMRRWPVMLLLLAGGCFDPLERCAGRSVAAGDDLECPMPGWLDRSFELRLPASWDGSSPLPLVVAFHGGGGNRQAAARVTCMGGDTGDPGCLAAVALAAGYAVLSPDGLGTRPVRNVRTWNAGGGAGRWQCVSGAACKSGADDLRYLDELFDEVARILPVDPARVHATGLSNGGAMSHRVACERPGRFASVAPVGGANQFAVAGGACPGGVDVLHIHGTEDPCWRFEESADACAQQDGGWKVGVPESTAAWAARNGCQATPVEELLPDADPDDGTRTTRLRYTGCADDVELLRIEGGGHTWPRGFAYFGEDTVGRVAQDFGSEVIVEFFRAHPRD
jgi:polyhydroxybutyrate depolymerase